MRRFLWTHNRLNGAGKALGFLMTGLGLAGLIFVSSPRPSHAICETPMEAWGLYTGAFTSTLTLLINMFTASAVCPGPPPACGILPNTYAVLIALTQATMILAIETMENLVLLKLKEFWDNWLKALKDMTGQLSGSLSDGTRHLDNMFDSSDETQKERALQDVEHNAKKQYQPTNQSCRFDTVARPLNSAMRTEKYVSQGLATALNVEGTNNTAAPASVGGQAGVENTRWNNYVNYFCDGVSNNGRPGCNAPAANAVPNADTDPKTLFGKETIDMSDATPQGQARRAAVQAFVYNITGYEIPDPMQLSVLRTPAGKQQRARRREYLAQMDASSALVTDLVGERTPLTGPGNPGAPEVQALRTKLGVTDASLHPSERELRQAVVEQLWDPNYWVELGDSPATIAEKEVYLQAYNLLMLYKIIEKTEKISTAYAIQTANLLDAEHSAVKKRGTEFGPLR